MVSQGRKSGSDRTAIFSRSESPTLAMGFQPMDRFRAKSRRRIATLERPAVQASLRDAPIVSTVRPWLESHGYKSAVATRPFNRPLRILRRLGKGVRGALQLARNRLRIVTRFPLFMQREEFGDLLRVLGSKIAFLADVLGWLIQE